MKKKLLAVLLGASLVSIGGVMHIKNGEGLRYTAYPDPGTKAEPWTICYGHTKGVYRGMTATRAQCEQWLREDIADAEVVIHQYVRVPLTQGEYDAYVSFVFNAGEGNFKSSTMLKLLNSGQHTAACNQFPRWVYADKRKLNGLVTRRYEEQAMCLKPSKVIYNGKPMDSKAGSYASWRVADLSRRYELGYLRLVP